MILIQSLEQTDFFSQTNSSAVCISNLKSFSLFCKKCVNLNNNIPEQAEEV